jgi:hypothetical protein
LIRIFCTAIFLLGAQCFGQVRIVLAKPTYSSEERVRATIVNRTHGTIVYCIHEFGETPPHGDQVESTFLPFQVQTPGRRSWKHLFIKRWGTILEPDIGVIDVKDELWPGESREFPFWLQDRAKEFRLILYYWSAPNPNVCSARKGGQRAVSKIFQMQ